MAKAYRSLLRILRFAALGVLCVGCAEPRVGVCEQAAPPGRMQVSLDAPPTPIGTATLAPCDKPLNHALGHPAQALAGDGGACEPGVQDRNLQSDASPG